MLDVWWPSARRTCGHTAAVTVLARWQALAEYTGFPPSHLVAGCGSDELLDVVLRLCEPGAVVSCPPTFGMYTFLSKICRYVRTPVMCHVACTEPAVVPCRITGHVHSGSSAILSSG